ncbi:tripartite tricarboxylate transporter substrate binding protein [Advenella sp. WQ 585]|uniref:Tripartite tricarboxylate transporter substrate binding protein n=1 Tax=Advenella mandrilli TaxID=2800330 RepID=A0ABS1EHK4_9BURK|nr:tripartite tricarboxylate transporter substrate binding protein [Advenella mandrilli]MBK1782474.1 tripartite tricarboxylate transporter substrate binding protein [Advenella mandrilli]
MNIMRAAVVTVGTLLSFNCFATNSVDYPKESIRMIMPYTPGGGADSLGRLMASKLIDTLKQQVIVENKPGANTMIATDYVANQKPDGYTILYASSSLTINPHIYKVRYDAEKDFAPVALLADIPLVMVTNKNSPYQSIQDVIEQAKVKEKGLTYGSYGQGSAAHLAGAMFQNMTGTEILHIPFKGSSPALVAVMGNHIDIGIVSLESALESIKSGEIKALGVFSKERVNSLQEVPAVTEIVPGCITVGWNAVVAPAGTKPEIVKILNEAINKTLQTPELTAFFTNQGTVPALYSPEKFAEIIRAENKKWGELVKETNLRIE